MAEDFGGVVASVAGTGDVHPLLGFAVEEVFDGGLTEEDFCFLSAGISGSGGEIIDSAGVDDKLIGGNFLAQPGFFGCGEHDVRPDGWHGLILLYPPNPQPLSPRGGKGGKVSP